MGMCRTTLIGVLSDEPKLYKSDKGYGVATLRVQVDQKKVIKGTPQTFTSWHTLKVFGDRATQAAEIAKGSTVMAFGDLRRNKYTGKDGTEKVSWEIAADYVEAMFGPDAQPVETEQDTPFVTPKTQGNPGYTPF